MIPGKVAIVANPASGTANRGVINEMVAELERNGWEVLLLWTERAPDSVAKLVAQAVRAGCKLIIPVGGDGTICAAANALAEIRACVMPVFPVPGAILEPATEAPANAGTEPTPIAGTDVAMAAYPGGTGNLWIRSWYSVPSVKRFVRMLMRGTPKLVDIVRLQYKDVDGVDQDIKYLVGMGLGKISDAISDADPKMKRRFGKLVYVVNCVAACLRRSGNHLEITAKGQTTVYNDGLTLFALNVTPPSMAALSRGCTACDGELDLVLFTGSRFREILRTVWALASGRPDRLEEEGYERIRASEIEIKISEPLRPNIDGDPTPAADPAYPLRLSVMKSAVPMILSA